MSPRGLTCQRCVAAAFPRPPARSSDGASEKNQTPEPGFSRWTFDAGTPCPVLVRISPRSVSSDLTTSGAVGQPWHHDLRRERRHREWTDATFNPWWGCERVSPACAHCYADNLATRWGHSLWQAEGPRRFLSESYWRKPLTWNAEAEATGIPTKVFCASMADVFEAHEELEPWRERLWALIEETPSLHWQLLTKRPENVGAMVPWKIWPANVWIGTSIENSRFTFRADILRELPAAVRFVSAEPLLGGRSLSVGAGLTDSATAPASKPCKQAAKAAFRDRL
jgi:protein gp37